ncbi:hypothetical protein HON22_00855 [Candidatus Peregrinibacteria bacterium]|jgi:hypothetical protein|nr:hypothetical protein [Candidatus Peregrinibacteria bacterium]
MQKIIKLFLLAFFTLNLLIPSTHADVIDSARVSADQYLVKNMAEDFYSDIRKKVEKEEKVRIEKRLELSTGIPGLIALAIQKDSEGKKVQEAVGKWCNTDENIFSSTDSCKQELTDLLSFDIELETLQTEIEVTAKADEIWSNGTLTDSVFDLVVDLNMIDIILFGLEAEIPKSRWSKQSGNASLGGAKTIGDSPPAFFDTSNSDGEASLSQSKIDSLGSQVDRGNTQDDTLAVIPAEEGIQDSQGTRNDKAIAAFFSPVIDTQNLQCRNPSEFAFINLIQTAPEEGTSSPAQGAPQDSSSSSENNQLGDTPNDASDLGSGSNSGAGSEGGSPVTDSSNLESIPIQFKKFKKKEGCLYGGFYCPPPKGGRGKNVSEENCDPLSGVCKKCSDPNKAVNYCFTWEYKKGENQLLSSVLVSDSISGYIDAGYKSYKSLLGAGPLTPTQQQNQAGFLTQATALFTTKPSISVSIEGKIPDMWTHEAKKVDLTHEGMKKYWKDMKEAEKKILNEGPQGDSPLSASEQRIFLENQRRQAEIDLRERQSKDIARKVYYKNVNQNLENFKQVFDLRFKDKMLNMPFQELEDAKVQCPKE